MTTETIYFDNDKNVSFTSYIPDASPEMPNCRKRPAVLIFPGGGYRFCSDREAEPIALAFLGEGYAAFILRYSVNESSVFPKPLHEAEKALEIMRINAKKYMIDAEKIAVIGFSAGGHLAASLVTMGKIRPNAAILGYPCILSSIGEVLYAPVPSLEKEVTSETPPCFIFSTADDNTVPVSNSLEFAAALNRNLVPFEMHIFPHGKHGMSLGKEHTSSGNSELLSDTVSTWFPMCIKWLNNLF